MKDVLVAYDSNNIDDKADTEILDCLSSQTPKSFFLFAGAGSGKTRSLIKALQYLQTNHSKYLRLYGKRVGVITYTNKACEEIKRRTGFDPLVKVSTIHGFVWTLIQGFNEDIKSWLKVELENEITDLREKQAKGRGGKASIDREKSIEAKTGRLISLPEIREFTYNPNGENHGRDSLNHSEVIKISAAFLIGKPVMQQLLINKFPILLIDESQDTNKMLMDAFFLVQAQHPVEFRLGLFGDMMQRIYADGKADLGQNLPADWAKPEKVMNHRCPKRIITLLNKIRAGVDKKEQKPRTDAAEGIVRFFILKASSPDKIATEKLIASKMAEISGDIAWNKPQEVKTLILEHHMAAKRMGFHDMYEPLYRNDALRIGLLDGTLSGLKFFTDRVLPLVEARIINDAFAVAAIVRKHSPLLSKPMLKSVGDKQPAQIQKAKEAVEYLWKLWEGSKTPRFIDILRNVAKTNLFEIPESLQPIASRSDEQQLLAEVETKKRIEDHRENETVLDNWDEFLLTSFDQAKSYVDYVNDRANFDTHQGVKGLEFPRVMVIIDDSAAKGFLFSYEKLFGVKAKTKSDLDNEEAGKETGIERTRRLFYVTCSRTEESLAIAAYSNNPQGIKQHVITQKWFAENEIEIIE
ncbi:UvrD-helicase domain-containing protein [Legionella pneumophila]|nr:UvrD-helicase domain-containing protein [Legionella pneumophila]MDW8925295.1 UvrD-helicase domain-containing protein [Legionella pneumophila]MDW8931247.1 UvrD-helicase domain-containing protein [Legionella pneumophila]MDW8933987.1 UvrD-helicase domain-containing protein [Legionella pneumophila]MDW8971794.1 UvrD-helicase domain-containing protein [Legionella pneumophila]